MSRTAIPLALCVAVFACTPRVPGPGPALRGRIMNAYAMRYVDVAKGSGASAVPGKRITVHYTGWLANGKKFDSSRDRNTPFTFTLGRHQVITGWDTGFEGMRVGGKRRLLIPYQLGYGARGRGEIPPKADLTFDVELLKVED